MVASTSVLNGGNPFGISAVSLLLFQAFIVIVTARLLSYVLRYLRQPVVVSEVIGGLILGGSALCRIPAFQQNLFPSTSLPIFSAVANFGLVFYLFLIGLELDPSKLLRAVGSSLPISIAGIALPFTLGVAVAKFIYDHYSSPDISFPSFLIFCGVSMSITAFPVLARILTERRLLHTKVGRTTIAAASIDDVTAWILLVLVIAIINNAGTAGASNTSYLIALYVFLVIAAFAVLLWFTLRPFYRFMLARAQSDPEYENTLLFLTYVLVLLAGWFTEMIGVQAIFGSFLVGAVIPHDYGFARRLASQIEDLIMIVFLPLYFAYSGLNTRLDQLNDGMAWGTVFLVIFVACAGKMIGCTSAAKLSGLSWRESAAVGILMNTKGLVELIVLNLGLNAGVITQKVFSIFVVMAVVTTLMTIPLLSIVYPPKFYADELEVVSESTESSESGAKSPKLAAEQGDDEKRKVLVLLPSMRAAQAMLAITSQVAGQAFDLTVFGLRMLPLDNRISTLMKATEREQVAKADPVLTVFKAFFGLQGVKSHSLLTFRNEVVPTVIEAAVHVSATTILLPDTPYRNVQEIVAGAPQANVVQFIDKGYGPHSNRAPDASSASADTVVTAPRDSSQPPDATVVAVLAGTADAADDDAEVLRFARLFAGPSSAGSGRPSATLRPIVLAPATGSAVSVDELGAKPLFMGEAASSSDVAAAARERITGGTDVVVIGAAALASLSEAGEAAETASTSSAAAAGLYGLRRYLEGATFPASVAVVHAHKSSAFFTVNVADA
ncbi:K(+)/H(+) antiporter [Cladochytrium tenue]|nr:K(+)/H(+) antiporter [Cladochytrium tenue]